MITVKEQKALINYYTARIFELEYLINQIKENELFSDENNEDYFAGTNQDKIHRSLRNSIYYLEEVINVITSELNYAKEELKKLKGN